MSNEFQTRYSSGLNLYALFTEQTDGKVYRLDNTSFENLTAGNWTHYNTNLSEQSTTGFYYGSMPGSVATGIYNVWFFLRAGATPAITDTCIGQGVLNWTGAVDSAALSYLPQAQAGAANGLLILGANTASLIITGSAGQPAVSLQAGSGSAHGLSIIGTGAGGDGIYVQGGNSNSGPGVGIQIQGGSAISGNNNGAAGLKVNGGTSSGSGIGGDAFNLTSAGISGSYDINLAGSGTIHGSLTGSIGSYIGNTPQTGDAYARLGAPAGASVSADIAEVETEVDIIAGAMSTGDPWATLEPGSYAGNTFGGFVVNQLTKLNVIPVYVQANPGVGGTLIIVRGTDLFASEGRQIDVAAPAGIDISTATSFSLLINNFVLCIGTYFTTGGVQYARFQPSAAQTTALTAGPLQPWQALVVLLNGHTVNLVLPTSVATVTNP